jgi:nucleotide-binding universal stress UspA family protein
MDGSDISRRAFEFAVSVARSFGGRVRVLEVAEGGPLATFPEMRAVSGLTLEARRHLADDLEQLVAPARETGLAVEVAVEEGDVVRQILREADAMPADLIVMGTHGRGGFERLVLGSVTEKVLRKAPCPVLTVPPGQGANGVDTSAFKAILCATDFSPAATEALEVALALCARAKARVILLHSIDWPFGDASFGAPKNSVDELRLSLEINARERLIEAVSTDAAERCRIDPRVTAGKAAHDIVRVADDAKVDLIVLGVRGRTPIDLALVGSTTHYVIRQASCPVLTIRPRHGAGC